MEIFHIALSAYSGGWHCVIQIWRFYLLLSRREIILKQGRLYEKKIRGLRQDSLLSPRLCSLSQNRKAGQKHFTGIEEITAGMFVWEVMLFFFFYSRNRRIYLQGITSISTDKVQFHKLNLIIQARKSLFLADIKDMVNMELPQEG